MSRIGPMTVSRARKSAIGRDREVCRNAGEDSVMEGTISGSEIRKDVAENS